MKLRFKERTVSTMVVIPSALIVLALAVLQLRWSARVSEATAVRLADSLQMSMTNWQKDFFRYFTEIGLAIRIDISEDARGDADQYVRRFAEWRNAAKYPALVSNVYLLKLDGAGEARAERLDPQAGHFEPGAWPEVFTPLRPALDTLAAGFAQKPVSDAPARPGESWRLEAGLNIGDPAMGWRFEPRTPAMLHPVLARGPGSGVDWIAVELNKDEIRKILGDLAQTYFQGTAGLDYEVAVVTAGKPEHKIYSSDPGFGVPEPADADGTVDIFGKPAEKAGYKASSSPMYVFHAPSDNQSSAPPVQVAWFPVLRTSAGTPLWRLVVRHRRGGALGAFVMEMRRRDLAIGFGVLLVLAVNMGMLIVTSHRAQRLAQLQMNFVTAVSHELRTPLTVIMSGADNLSSGVVETKKQIAQYGSLIGTQAKQLFGLVEQILLFATSRQSGLHYNLRPLEVPEVIDAALRSTAGLIEAKGFAVEREVPAGLPRVAGDPSALSQCLQNLITNALKYGSGQSWMAIRAAAFEAEGARGEVRITVADRGIGISPEEVPHIFEPFYRSPAARAAQIHGTGLGLPLARSIAEAMNGRLTVTSVAGQGSAFTLHLPFAAEEAAAPGV